MKHLSLLLINNIFRKKKHKIIFIFNKSYYNNISYEKF